MASPAVTYTFSNSTTADASQVNQNFTDIINALTDGTKDLSISALTCAGNVALNGNTTIGNASSDTLTVTASLASSVSPSAHNTYDFGTVTTLGFRAFYFASSSATKTAKVQGPAISSDITVTLPTYTGTLRNIPTVISSQTTTYSILASDEFVPVSGASAAFTATLPTAVGVAGKVYYIKRTDNTLANAVTIGTTSSQTIDGSTTTTLNTQYEGIEVISDGSNWHVLRRHIPSVWTSYTPTGGWTNNTSYTGYWRRVGDSVEVAVKVALAGLPNAATFSVNLPSNITIDTAKLPGTNYQAFGNVVALRNGVAWRHAGVAYSSTTAVVVYHDAGAGAWTDSLPYAWTVNDIITLHFTVPVSGWKG